MNEYVYMIKGIMAESTEEEKDYYQKGYQATKEILNDADDAATVKAMGMLVALVETGMFDE